MNKNDLIISVADKAEITKKEAETIVDAVFDEITKNLLAGKEVKISGFGIFAPKKRKERVGTNPANQAKITIPASKTVTFKVSKILKASL